MKTVGASGTIDAVFTPTDRNVEKIAGRGVVVCVGVTSGTKSNFTITSSTNEPDYSMLSYKDERNISVSDSLKFESNINKFERQRNF